MSDIYEKRHVMTKRFPALPDISRDSPTTSGQIVPYSQNEDIITKLETRLTISEKSSRSLLEEVVRLQNENKVMQHNTDEFMREEYKRRQHMATSLQNSFNDLLSLQNKQKQIEEAVGTSNRSMLSIGARCTGLEALTGNNVKEIHSQREAFATRLDQLREGLDESRRSRTQLERLAVQLNDDMRQQRNSQIATQRSLEGFGDEFSRRCLKIEDEAARSTSTIRTNSQQQVHLEQTWSHLRVQIETRLAELREIFTEQRKTQDAETKERHILQQQTQINLAEVRQALQRSSQEQNESLRAHSVDQSSRVRDLDRDISTLRALLAQTTEEITVKHNARENKLRDENSGRFDKIEEMIINEIESRQNYERKNRDALEVRWINLEKSIADDNKQKDSNYMNDRRKMKETLNKLNEAILLVESQLCEQRRNQEKLIASEIQSRQQSEKNTIRKLDVLQQKLSTATASLTQNINASTNNNNNKIDKLAAEIVRLQEINAANIVSDKEAEQEKLSERMKILQGGIDEKINTIQIGLRKLTETVQTVKTVLTIKHSTEQKQRVKDQTNSHTAVAELAKIIDNLLLKDHHDSWTEWKDNWLPILEKEID